MFDMVVNLNLIVSSLYQYSSIFIFARMEIAVKVVYSMLVAYAMVMPRKYLLWLHFLFLFEIID